MRSIRTKVTRIERVKRDRAVSHRYQNRALKHQLCFCLVENTPGIARVRPEHTDPETYRDIQETLAWARGDYAEAERLADLRPDKHVPPPPGTPWAERMRLAREALDRCAGEAHESRERVRKAIDVADGGEIELCATYCGVAPRE